MTTPLAVLPLSLRLALRELRAGFRGFYIFLVCLFLGVATIASIGNLSGSLVAGLAQRGQEILGGDMDVRLVHRQLVAAEQSYLAAQGELSHVATMRVMAQNLDTGQNLLVEAKAIDEIYPLAGTLDLQGDAQRAALFTPSYAAFIEQSLLDQLDVALGDEIKLGDIKVKLVALIAREPDRLAGGFALGPRLMVSHATLTASGLNQPGAVISHHYRLKLAQGDATRLDQVRTALDNEFPLAGWRLRDRRDASPAVRRTVERVGLFLTLVGLTALAVGGIGVGNAISAYLTQKRKTLAIYKALGARQALVGRIYLNQIVLLASIAIGAGLLFAVAALQAAQPYLQAILDIPLTIRPYLPSLGAATLFGLATAVGFTLAPLGVAAQLNPAALFRGAVEDTYPPLSAVYRFAILACLGIIIGLSFAISERADITLYFILALASSYVLLRITAWSVGQLARRMGQGGRFGWRLAWRNMTRPGAVVQSVILSVGLAVTLIATLAQIEGNFSAQLQRDFPDRAPSFFAIDIQPSQRTDFVAYVTSQSAFRDYDMVPMLRGSVLALNGVPVANITPSPDIAWFLRGDRGLTYAATPPADEHISAGEWWPADYMGPPLVSMDQRIASGLGLELGDRIKVNVLGRALEAEITNFRRVDYGSGQIAFALIFSPSPLQAAPHTMLATISMAPEAEQGFSRALTSQFSNITLVRVKDAIETVAQLLAQFANAIWLLSVVTILASVFVLAGALASSRQGRLKDAAILLALGARRAAILRVFITEYAILSALAAVIAGGLSTVASWAILTFTMRASFALLPWHIFASLGGAFLLTLALSGAVIWLQLYRSPVQLLRSE
jgi:putative ABC transport system permease protein